MLHHRGFHILAATLLLSVGQLSPSAHADTIDQFTVALDYSVTFGTDGTDTIAGTVTFDPDTTMLTTNITVTGPVAPATYTGSVVEGGPLTGGAILFGATTVFPIQDTMSGNYMPATFAPTVVFTRFVITETTRSKSNPRSAILPPRRTAGCWGLGPSPAPI